VRSERESQTARSPIEVRRVVPILRIFDEAKAREFYVEFLGCTIDWEHRFAPASPIYMQVSRSGLQLHLSEHHGDGTPGSYVFVEIDDAASLHAELIARAYKYNKPGLDRMPWGTLQVSVVDPFNNKLNFNQYDKVTA
jgi:uncharacterized glyoxalase superfamily protein PhnB